MPKAMAGALILFWTVAPALADGPRVEAFGGFSYLRTDVDVGDADAFGWNAAIEGNVNSWFGLEADFSGHYRSFSFTSPIGFLSTNFDLSLFLFGPRFTFRQAGRAEPFAHALFGAAHAGASVGAPGGFAAGDTAAAAALGGGLDVRANRLFAIRALQADYVYTRFGGDGQNHLRISTGVVFRFGSVD